MVSIARPLPLLRNRLIEDAWKSLWFPAVEATLRRRSRRRPRDLRQRPLHVLFLRHDRLGDAIVSSPLLRALSESGIRVDVLCSRRNREVLSRYSYVSDLPLYEKRPLALGRLVIRFRRRGYDAVIDPIVTKRSMTSMLLMLASGAPNTVGFMGCGSAGLTHPVGGDTVRDPIGALLLSLAEPFGIEVSGRPCRPELPVRTDEVERASAAWEAAGEGWRVLVNCSGGHAARQWPTDRYVAVIRGIRGRFPEAKILVVGAPDSWDEVSSIASASEATAVETGVLGTLIGLIATADFVFTPDTSVAHMAAAFRRPAVAMYLPGTASQWGMPGPEALNLESDEDHLAALQVDRVLPEVLGHLARTCPPQPVTGAAASDD